MQMNKAQLKALVKECVVEVLQEGIMQQGVQLAENVSRPGHKQIAIDRNASLQKNVKRTPTYNYALDTPLGRATPQASARQIISPVVGSGAVQDLMASLLADTAQTTLLEQNQHESMGGSAPLDAASLMASKIDPLNLPGANNWAAVAGLIDE